MKIVDSTSIKTYFKEHLCIIGSCLCGAIHFELKSAPKAVSNCHCRMCQKQHGAAFATYGSVPRIELSYLSGEELLQSYHSSEGIVRRFCKVCGSNVEWSGSKQFPGWTSIAVALLDTPFKPEHIRNIHLESQVCWLQESILLKHCLPEITTQLNPHHDL